MTQKFPLLLLLLLVAGCQKEADSNHFADSATASDQVDTIRFVLPVGFSGVINIGLSPSGLAINRNHGVYEIPVPKNGDLLLLSTAFLKTWHHESAVYADGIALADGDAAAVPTNAICFFGSGSDSNGNIKYFVGTRAQVDQLQKSPWLADDLLKSRH